jgi:hypothetical protein
MSPAPALILELPIVAWCVRVSPCLLTVELIVLLWQIRRLFVPRDGRATRRGIFAEQNIRQCITAKAARIPTEHTHTNNNTDKQDGKSEKRKRERSRMRTAS